MTTSLPLAAAWYPSSLLVAILAILVACRLAAVVARFIGQPPVVAEMIAGVMLGPSLLGLLAPEVSAWIFPDTVRATLGQLSQVGLALYMFAVGAELKLDLVVSSWRVSAAVSLAGLLTPFVLGAAIGFHAVAEGGFFTDKVGPWEGAFFLGAALCITAFPMLARIIRTQGLTHTRLGTVALGAGALDDVAAWILLAAVVASTSGVVTGFALASVGGAIFVLAVAFVARPLLARWGRVVEARGAIGDWDLPLVLAVALIGATITDFLGLHAVFGAFAMGAAMPRGLLGDLIHQRLEPVVTALLLPVFFTYSGLQTQLPSLLGVGGLSLMVLVLLGSVVGKAAACSLASRAMGLGWRESFAVGSLMNARGLMELIVINIGLQAGLIEDTLFAVLVVMAIVTTLMATPMFHLTQARFR